MPSVDKSAAQAQYKHLNFTPEQEDSLTQLYERAGPRLMRVDKEERKRVCEQARVSNHDFKIWWHGRQVEDRKAKVATTTTTTRQKRSASVAELDDSPAPTRAPTRSSTGSSRRTPSTTAESSTSATTFSTVNDGIEAKPFVVATPQIGALLDSMEFAAPPQPDHLSASQEHEHIDDAERQYVEYKRLINETEDVLFFDPASLSIGSWVRHAPEVVLYYKPSTRSFFIWVSHHFGPRISYYRIALPLLHLSSLKFLYNSEGDTAVLLLTRFPDKWPTFSRSLGLDEPWERLQHDFTLGSQATMCSTTCIILHRATAALTTLVNDILLVDPFRSAGRLFTGRWPGGWSAMDLAALDEQRPKDVEFQQSEAVVFKYAHPMGKVGCDDVLFSRWCTSTRRLEEEQGQPGPLISSYDNRFEEGGSLSPFNEGPASSQWSAFSVGDWSRSVIGDYDEEPAQSLDVNPSPFFGRPSQMDDARSPFDFHYVEGTPVQTQTLRRERSASVLSAVPSLSYTASSRESSLEPSFVDIPAPPMVQNDPIASSRLECSSPAKFDAFDVASWSPTIDGGPELDLRDFTIWSDVAAYDSDLARRDGERFPSPTRFVAFQ